MSKSRPAGEIARLGDDIYERVVRAQVERDHEGEYVAIDVESGCWALAEDLRAASKSLRAQQPEAVDVWLLRVGHRTLHHMGVLWDGQMRYGLADAAATTPLVGMSLLRGYELHIDVEPGGRVVVESR